MNVFAKEHPKLQNSNTFASHFPPCYLGFPRVRQNSVPVGWSMDRVHGVVHGPGPYGWSMDRVHGVVHGSGP